MQDYQLDSRRGRLGYPWPLHDSPLQTEQPHRRNWPQSKERTPRFLMALVPGQKHDFIPHCHTRQLPRRVRHKLYEGNEQHALREMSWIQKRPSGSQGTEHNGSPCHHWIISNFRWHHSVWSCKSWPWIWRPKDSRNSENTRSGNWKNAFQLGESVWKWSWTRRHGR